MRSAASRLRFDSAFSRRAAAQFWPQHAPPAPAPADALEGARMRRLNRRASWVWLGAMVTVVLLGSDSVFALPRALQIFVGVIQILATVYFGVHLVVALWLARYASPAGGRAQRWSGYFAYAALPCALLACLPRSLVQQMASVTTWILLAPHVLLGAWCGFARVGLSRGQRVPLLVMIAVLLVTVSYLAAGWNGLPF